MEYMKMMLKKTAWFSILESIIFAILGIILVCIPEGTVKMITWLLGTIFIVIAIIKIITYIIGVWIIYTSFIRINSAIQIKRLGSEAWMYGLILAIIMFLCGLYVIVNSSAIVVTIGTIMIIYSVIDVN